MGNVPADRRKKKRRGKNSKKRSDPRTRPIVSKAGPVTITKADGTVEVRQPLPATKERSKLYPKARARKAL